MNNDQEKEPDDYDKELESMVGEMLPEEREEMGRVLQRLTNELMEKTQRLRMLEEELKSAVKRKKPKQDVMLGKHALVLFSRPNVKDAKVRMHTVDNVPGVTGLQSVKSLMRDPDNEFIGAYFLKEMRGKKDGYKRLETNAETAWHLFQCLDKDLKTYDPENPREEGAAPDPYAEDAETPNN